jgi:hypothetical protein
VHISYLSRAIAMLFFFLCSMNKTAKVKRAKGYLTTTTSTAVPIIHIKIMSMGEFNICSSTSLLLPLPPPRYV